MSLPQQETDLAVSLGRYRLHPSNFYLQKVQIQKKRGKTNLVWLPNVGMVLKNFMSPWVTLGLLYSTAESWAIASMSGEVHRACP